MSDALTIASNSKGLGNLSLEVTAGGLGGGSSYEDRNPYSKHLEKTTRKIWLAASSVLHL